MTRRRLLAALALALLTTALLSLGHRQVGYVRDEGIYFSASRQYAAWTARLLSDPRAALSARERDRAFHENHEHPALLKTVAGVSARWLAQPGHPAPGDPAPAPAGLLPLLPEGAAMRLPAQLLAGLAVALLFLAGAALADRPPAPSASPPGPPDRPELPWLAGLCAALWFIALPHVWFHAGLHCFDVPVAVATLAVVLVYRRALQSRRWALALGPALGLAVSVKHNALFLPVLLAVHYAACLALARRRPTRGQWLPLPFVSMAVLAPLTVVALWPWLWTDPVGRLLDWLEFHRLHAYYNTEYFGINYNRPPLPVSYPFVLTWATVPTGMLLLALIGLALGLRRDLSLRTPAPPPTPAPAPPDSLPATAAPVPPASLSATAAPVPPDSLTAPAPPDTATAAPVPPASLTAPTPPAPRFSAPLAGQDRRDGLLLALFAAFPLCLIALPTIPIFGGTKHWLTAYPFLALAAAAGWIALARASHTRRWLAPAVLLLVLVPGAWSTIDAHPYGLSQYAPLVGGPRGAADLGLLRGFWGHAVPPGLLRPDATARPDEPGVGPTYLHDLHELARRQYVREGRWPADAAPAGPSRARTGLLFHERHMLSLEIDLWQHLGPAPSEVVTLDDVPLTSAFRRDRSGHVPR